MTTPQSKEQGEEENSRGALVGHRGLIPDESLVPLEDKDVHWPGGGAAGS